MYEIKVSLLMHVIKYGEYPLDDKFVCVLNEDTQFDIKRTSYNTYLYNRYEKNELKVSKTIVDEDTSKLGIFPIVPQNIPNKYAEHMMITFDPLIINHNVSLECYIIMPIEIGITLNNTIIDILSLGSTKYGLYGTPERGIICRYYKSNVYTQLPYVSFLREAIAKCIFRNYSDDSKIINKIVYPIDGKDLYYKDTTVYFDMLEITIESKLNIDVVNVKVLNAEWNAEKTNFGKQSKNNYMMEWGF